MFCFAVVVGKTRLGRENFPHRLYFGQVHSGIGGPGGDHRYRILESENTGPDVVVGFWGRGLNFEGSERRASQTGNVTSECLRISGRQAATQPVRMSPAVFLLGPSNFLCHCSAVEYVELTYSKETENPERRTHVLVQRRQEART